MWNSKTDIFSPEWCEIVFEDRNKEYGAYHLRKSYENNIVMAILLAVLAFAFFVTLPLLIEWISGVVTKDVVLKKETEVILAEPPPIDKNEPPPPPVEPPPPLKSTIKFTPPVIKKDEEVPEEEAPPTQEQMAEVDPGAKTVEGDPEGVPDIGTGNEVVEDAGVIFRVVEQMPTFPGGDDEMYKFLGKTIKYPPIAKEENISGRVFLTFVVDPEGNIKDIQMLRGIGGGCDEEAIRAVKAMPRWQPGKQNGRSVSVQFNLPVLFSLK